jgi:GAF domain-containing protein
MDILDYIAFANDSNRIEKINNLRFLANQEFFDNITLLASKICHTQFAAIKIVKNTDYYLKSVYSTINKDFLSTTPEERSIYTPVEYTILQNEHTPLIINNIDQHPIFKNYFYVVNPPHIKFYCGFPLFSIENEPLGCFCIADSNPLTISPENISILDTLCTLTKQFIAVSPHIPPTHKSMIENSFIKEQ